MTDRKHPTSLEVDKLIAAMGRAKRIGGLRPWLSRDDHRGAQFWFTQFLRTSLSFTNRVYVLFDFDRVARGNMLVL